MYLLICATNLYVFASMCNLANVDPIDVAKTITRLNPETTLG